MDRKVEVMQEHRPRTRIAPSAVRAYIALGSNLGDRKRNMEAAIEKLARIDGVEVTKASSFYETEPVGGPPQGMYLNAVLEIECSLSAGELLRELRRVENELGRKRPGKNYPRTIDLDILLFGNDVIDEREVKVPHPRMHERSFVLDPLNEIAPNVPHPVLGFSVAELRQKHAGDNAAIKGVTAERLRKAGRPYHEPGKSDAGNPEAEKGKR